MVPFTLNSFFDCLDFFFLVLFFVGFCVDFLCVCGFVLLLLLVLVVFWWWGGVVVVFLCFLVLTTEFLICGGVCVIMVTRTADHH